MASSDPGPCPWCRKTPAEKPEAKTLRPALRCSCGALALAAEGADASFANDLSSLFEISISTAVYDLKDSAARWLADFHIERRSGRPGWTWLLRKLPWEAASGAMTDAERLKRLAAQAEDFYERFYDSRAPRADFREAEEAFESAIELARRLGRPDEARRLEDRLKHLHETRRRFSGS